MIDYILYITYIIFAFIIRVMPTSIMKYILLLLSKLVYIIDVRHRNIAFTNLDLAYKDTLNSKEKEIIVKNSYNNILFNLYEFVKTQNSTLEDMDNKITLCNDKYILDAIKENKKIILVTAHYGGWELAIPYLSLKFRPISVISKPIKNKYINKMFKKVRHAHNLEMFEKHGAAKKMLKALKNDRIIAMAIDQSISKKDAVVVNFFGHKVTQTDSPVRLASKLGAVVIPFILERDGFEKHKAIFYEPIKPKKDLTEDEIVQYSQNISDIFESQIKDKPNDWFWQHRRWKAFYKKIYNK